jgi:hypothetical protein
MALGFEQLTIQFAKGDRHARRDLFFLAEKFGIDLTGALQAAAEAVSPDHQKFLDAYKKRLLNHDIVEQKRVLAPDDLLDDDVEKKR